MAGKSGKTPSPQKTPPASDRFKVRGGVVNRTSDSRSGSNAPEKQPGAGERDPSAAR